MKVALRAFQETSLPEEEELRWLWLACHIARALCDDAAWDELDSARSESSPAGPARSPLPRRGLSTASSSISSAGRLNVGHCPWPPRRTPVV